MKKNTITVYIIIGTARFRKDILSRGKEKEMDGRKTIHLF